MFWRTLKARVSSPSWAEPAEQPRVRLTARGRRQDHRCAAQLLKRLRRVCRLAVDVVVRAEAYRELLLGLPARDGGDAESHVPGVLHGQVPEAADPLYRDQVARARTRVAERVEGGQARAEKRSGVDRLE